MVTVAVCIASGGAPCKFDFMGDRSPWVSSMYHVVLDTGESIP